MRQVGQLRRRVRGPDAEAAYADGHGGVGRLVIFAEPGKGLDLRWHALDVCPAAVAEGARDSGATAPGVGGYARGARFQSGCTGTQDAMVDVGEFAGIDGEEGGVAAGGNVGYERG